VGQAEVEIARLAHTTLVIEAPGLGDDIQAIKAGILEIADILVINKSDQPGVDNAERALRAMLDLAGPRPGWIPPIQRTVATLGTGIPELAVTIHQHRQHLLNTGELLQRDLLRLQSELDFLLKEALVTKWRGTVSDKLYQDILNAVRERRLSPHQAVQRLILGDEA
jgi:LAO/AO transport system kinase